MNEETLFQAIGRIDDDLIAWAEETEAAGRFPYGSAKLCLTALRSQIACGVACAVALGSVKPVYQLPQIQEIVPGVIIVMNVIFGVLLALIAALVITAVIEQVHLRKLRKERDHCGALVETIMPDRAGSAMVSFAILIVGGILLWAYLSGISGGSSDPVMEKTYIRMVVTLFVLAALYVVVGLLGGVYLYEKVIFINTGLHLHELYRDEVERVDYGSRFCTIIPYTGKPVVLRRVDYKNLEEKLRKTICMVLIPLLLLSSGALRRNAEAAEREPNLRIAMSAGQYTSYDLEFQKLIAKYERESGKKVEVKVYDSPEELTTKLNIELFAGEGPDLFLGTDLALDTLVERGSVDNYLEWMERDPEISYDDFFPNIMDPLKSADGGLYLLPISFRFNFVIPVEKNFEKAEMKLPGKWTLEEVMADCVEFTNKTPAGKYAMAWGDEILPRAVQNELMAAMLDPNTDAVLKLNDVVLEYLVKPSEISSNDMLGMNGLFDISPFLYMSQEMTLDSCLSAISMILFENDGTDVRNFPRTESHEGEYFYTPMFSLCMNSAGRTEEAWKLMKFLLSEEVQTGKRNDQYGVLDQSGAISNPVNIAAAAERERIIREDMAEQAELKRNGQVPVGRLPQSKHPVDEWSNRINDYLASYERLRNALTTPVLSDAALKASALQFIDEQPDNVRASKLKGELRRMVQVYRGETAGDLEQGYTTLYWIAGGAAAVGAAAAVVTVVRKRRKARR